MSFAYQDYTSIVLSKTDGDPGYYLGPLIPLSTFQKIKTFIEANWRSRILSVAGNHLRETVDSLSIEEYHKINNLDHNALWPKSARMLDQNQATELLHHRYFESLLSTYNNAQVSDEEGLGYPNLYWRIVRPNVTTDVGPLHRDSWFWQINAYPCIREKHQRVKVWIPITTVQNKSGLRIQRGSHLNTDISYSIRYGQRENKPQIISEVDPASLTLLPTKNGEPVIFHDDLLHGGVVNTSSVTRVSLEFTMLVPS